MNTFMKYQDEIFNFSVELEKKIALCQIKKVKLKINSKSKEGLVKLPKLEIQSFYANLKTEFLLKNYSCRVQSNLISTSLLGPVKNDVLSRVTS